MAGLCAAARARELGASPTVLEKGDRPGGSMLLSSGVVWRYRSLEDFRRDWLESLGAPVVRKETGNPRTVGRRFDPRGLTDALVRAAGAVQTGHALGTGAQTGPDQPLLLATGGFPVRLARKRALALRSNPWSQGDGLDLAVAAGAATTAGMDEFYGRAMPAPPARWGEAELVDHAQLYGRFATVLDEQGARIPHASADWSENALVQEVARRGGRAWYVVDRNDLGRETPYGTVAEAIDKRARVVDRDNAPIPGLYAAGVDAGGWSTGGYASGLAAALVLGLVAAESAAS